MSSTKPLRPPPPKPVRTFSQTVSNNSYMKSKDYMIKSIDYNSSIFTKPSTDSRKLNKYLGIILRNS